MRTYLKLTTGESQQEEDNKKWYELRFTKLKRVQSYNKSNQLV